MIWIAILLTAVVLAGAGVIIPVLLRPKAKPISKAKVDAFWNAIYAGQSLEEAEKARDAVKDD